MYHKHIQTKNTKIRTSETARRLCKLLQSLEEDDIIDG